MKHVYTSLEPVYDEVEYNGKQMRLVELDVPGVAEYKNAQAQSIKFGADGGMSRLSGSGDLDPLLVRLTLREPVNDKWGKLSKTFVESLPAVMVRELADRAREMNFAALNEMPTAEAIDQQIEALQALKAKLPDPNAAQLNGTTRSSV